MTISIIRTSKHLKRLFDKKTLEKGNQFEMYNLISSNFKITRFFSLIPCEKCVCKLIL